MKSCSADGCWSCVDDRGEGSFWKSSRLSIPRCRWAKERKGAERVKVLIFLFYKVGSQEMLLNGNEIKN